MPEQHSSLFLFPTVDDDTLRVAFRCLGLLNHGTQDQVSCTTRAPRIIQCEEQRCWLGLETVAKYLVSRVEVHLRLLHSSA